VEAISQNTQQPTRKLIRSTRPKTNVAWEVINRQAPVVAASRSVKGRWPIALVCAAIAGCQFTPPGKPSSYPTTTVVGTVTVDGRAVRGGWISVHPWGGTLGDHAIGRIRDDGTYRIEAVPIGRLSVQIHVAPGMLPDNRVAPANFRQFLASIRGPMTPLRLDTGKFGNQPMHYDVDLMAASIAAKMAEPK
jgi:hypothetical protein